MVRRVEMCWLTELFKGKEKSPPVFIPVRTMDINEVSSILIDKFPDAPIYLPDLYYKACKVQDIEKFLEWDNASNIKYVAEAFDCDDFAWRLKGNITMKGWSEVPFFVVWTDKHAMCGFISSEGEFYFVEPQSDEIQKELQSWQGSEIRFIAG